MIRLVVLGTSGSMPSPSSPPSCFAIKWGGVYLFDCCEGAQRQMMKYGVSFAGVNAIFISHLHADHFLGIFGLVHSLNFTGRKEPLYIFGPDGTEKFLKTAFAMREFKPHFEIKIQDVSAGKKPFYSNELFTVKAFKVKHNAPAAIGFVVEGLPYRRFDEAKARAAGVKGALFTKLQKDGKATINGKIIKFTDVSYVQQGKKIVYTGDTMQCPAIATNSKGADLLVHDACFSQEHVKHAKEKMHSTVTEAATNAKKAKVKKLLLTHFSNRYDDKSKLLAEAKAVFEQSELGECGKELLI